MTTQYWLVKQEPSDYSWDEFRKEGRTSWTGVRNNAARLHLKGMHRGDEVFFYHSGEGKCIVGIARVSKAAYPDPTAEEPGWVAVDLTPVRALARPVTLAEIKADPALNQMLLVRQSRLSVMPVTAVQFERILKLAGS